MTLAIVLAVLSIAATVVQGEST